MMKVTTLLLLLLLLISAANAEKQKGEKDYPLALEISETQSLQSAHDAAIAEGSDGNLYAIACADRSRNSRFRALAQSLSKNPDSTSQSSGVPERPAPDCDGVMLVPGTVYRARWEKGNLKIAVTSDKPKEATFTVVRSQKMNAQQIDECKVCVLVKAQ